MAAVYSVRIEEFSKALQVVKDKPVFTISSPRHKKVLSDIEDISKNISKDSVSAIISAIVRDLETIIKSVKPGKHIASHIWPLFHHHRQGKMVQEWNRLSDAIGIEIDSIVIQDVSMEILLAMIGKPGIVSLSGKPAVVRVFSAVEEQAIMYAGGYVVKKMLEWVDSIGDEVATEYYEALHAMLEGGKWDDLRTDSFEEFIRNWIADVDRGGLKILNITALQFFKELESITFNKIEARVNMKKAFSASSVAAELLEDEDLQFCWTTLAVDIKHEVDSKRLFCRITELWTKIKGHSYASAITETYKQTVSQNTQKSKGIRKKLKMDKEVCS